MPDGVHVQVYNGDMARDLLCVHGLQLLIVMSIFTDVFVTGYDCV